MEPTNKHEEKEKDGYVLTYGALLAKNVNLQKLLSQEKVWNKFLRTETKIQAKIIHQLKSLLQCQTKPPSICSLGHRLCLIDHNRYNFMKQPSSKPLIVNASKIDPVVIKEITTQTPEENAFLVKMSRRINQLQCQYGVPPALRQTCSTDLLGIFL